MRRTLLRTGLVALLGVAFCLVATPDPRPAVAQQRIPAQPVPPTTADDGGPKPEGFQAFTFPVERDATQRLDAVIDYMKKKTVPWEIVCSTAQQLLDAKSDSFYSVKNDKGKETGTRVSVKAKINDLIGELPKEGKQFYELTYGGTADALLKDAVAAGYDRAILADVSQRYFHTKAGGQATLVLAGLHLDAGNYAEAAYAYQKLLNRPESDEFLPPRVLFKAAVALKRSGDARQSETSSKMMDRLEKKFPRDGLAIGQRTYSLDELKKQLDRKVELGGFSGDGLVTRRYGNTSHTGVGVGGTPFLDPSFAVPLLYRREDSARSGAEWVSQNIDAALKSLDRSKRQVALPGFFPVSVPGMILYRGYDGIYAMTAKEGHVYGGKATPAGEVLWWTDTDYGAQSLASKEDRTAPIKQWWTQAWYARQPSVLFDNAQVGSLSHDGENVYYIDDLAVPPPGQYYDPNMGRGMPQTTIGLDHNRLHAINLESAKRVWDIGKASTGTMTEEEEAKTTNTAQLMEGAYFLGPPLPLNGKLYVLYERNRQIKLACLDPSKITQLPGGGYPALVWTQNLGSPNTQLNQDPLRRTQAAYLAAADGVLVCPTNAGAIVGVDINARSLLWARYYGPNLAAGGPGSPKALGGLQPFPGQPGMPNQQLPLDRWRAAAPIIVGNRVIVTAHDSETIQCVDLRTGDVQWSDARQKDDLYVGGVMNDKVIVVGKESVRAYTLAAGPDKQPVLAWSNLRIGTPTGHGVASKEGLYYVPVVGNPDKKNSTQPAIWVIDVASGLVKSKTELRRKGAVGDDPRMALGNLMFHEGQLFSQTATEIVAFPLIELKRQEMARRLAANPKDPEGLADRGELFLDDGQIKEAIGDLESSLANNPTVSVRKRVEDKLHFAYTELLRDKFAEGEQYLDKYKALCEVTIDPDITDVKKTELMDERVRRRALYLSILAKGRQKQGRLVEAFDAYRAFAAIGDSKQLVDIYDEPNAKTRPDVWARGRIDAMLRNAKDAADRKPLEDRVVKDWESIRAANDLGQLREFVKVFGPYFAVGREAQLFLAEKLLVAGNDEDLRDAQTNLMQLWATSEDDTHAAKAVEALARIMVKRGMLEDAVGLYTTLGTRYGTTVLRDGKTGADLHGELITNRTLLPYLEPSRGPTGSKYKVEPQVTPSQRGYAQSFMIEPEGDLFPFYRRFSLALLQNNQNTQKWFVTMTDRVTGEERHRFPDIENWINPYTGQQGPPTYRMAQANGNLVLLTIGSWAYCFDLAEKRELWRFNLLGTNVPAFNPNNPNANPRPEQQADGDVLFHYEDGWTLRLGRAAVLQPTYVCLVAQEGVVCLDPTNGQKLWVRSNVSKKVQAFGDARHVYLIDGGTAKVLRAMDGSLVEGVKDFAPLYTGGNRVAVLGRQLLMSEGGTSGPRVLRLYDVLTGQDVWKKEYPEKSLTLKTLEPDVTGCLAPNGAMEVLNSRTGEVLFKAKLDADRAEAHLKNVTEPLLLSDAERYFLFLNRGDGNHQPAYGTMIRSQKVHGVAYGFEKATGKRLWFSERLFEQQYVFTDRFEDMPVIVAAAQFPNEDTKQQKYHVAVLDKQLGKLRYFAPHQPNQAFYTLTFEPKTRVYEFWRYDLRVRIVPDDDTASK